MKKYLLISEVEKLLGISKVNLRYLEKQNTEISIVKIRGRRYYRQEDLARICEFLGISHQQNISQEDNCVNISNEDVRHNFLHEDNDIFTNNNNSISMQLDMFSVIEKMKQEKEAKDNLSRNLEEQKILLLQIKDNLLKFLK